MSANGADLVVVHLYPRLLRTYGDRGNVLTLARRAEWRGFQVRLVDVEVGEPLPPDAGLVVLGGGTDRVQEIIGADLASRRAELGDAAARGAVILGICGGYQFLGRRYVTLEGRSIEGLGLLDVETVARARRIIGRVNKAHAALWGREFDLVGFENHGGRTSLGPQATPLARVPRGGGNDGRDGTEGAVQGTILGTYLHGPVVPVNPAFADAVLERALAPATGGAPLAPLEDGAERRAHDEALRRPPESAPRRRRLLAVAAVLALLLALAGRAAATEIDEDGALGTRVAVCATNPTEVLLHRTVRTVHDRTVHHGGYVGWSIRSSASAASHCSSI